MKSVVRYGGVAFVALLAAGCALLSPGPTPTPTQAPPCGDVSMTMTADWGPYVIAGLTEEGTLHGLPVQSGAPDAAIGATIVVGEVTGFDVGIVDPAGSDNRQWRVFTPVRVRVEKVIRGDVEPRGFGFLLEGGKAGCLSERVDTAPQLNKGARYLFFLYPMRTSDGVVHPDRLQLGHDAWQVNYRDEVSTPSGPMPLADLVGQIERIVAAASPSPE